MKKLENQKRSCTFCNGIFYEYELTEVQILVGCCDTASGFLCNKCYKHPTMPIRRINIKINEGDVYENRYRK